ncbi:hypothetical protein GCM10010393_56700 [Streptomyces gobitricini]|uniref:Uncharacterized protein n=1 Tax=Streptomyces gobitricini TaxID=68211 RepID=A0ABP6AFS1_9ACTN
MSSAPIVVHRPSSSGGRRVTVHRQGQDEIFGTTNSDHDLVVFLEGAGSPLGRLPLANEVSSPRGGPIQRILQGA